MKLDAKDRGCPLHKFKPCKQLACAWFIQLRGLNPNTGQEIDEWGLCDCLATHPDDRNCPAATPDGSGG